MSPPRDNLLSTVNQGIEAGLCILPPDPCGSKRPLPGGKNEWIGYQTTKPTPEEIRNWYSDATVTGIGVVCGHDGLECLDFDERAIFEDYDNAAVSSGLGDLLARIKAGYCEHSPNGVHLLYRCEEISGNTKLATRPKKTGEMKDPNDKTKTLIETRGKGGYIITAPSYGTVNPSGTYQNISGSFETICIITPDERKALHELARTFNQFDDKQLEVALRQASRDTKSGGRPGDDFNCRARWEDILLKHGWIKVLTIGGTTYWRRPGKASGISATTNHQGSDLLYVFTSSTPFEPNRGYSKFSAYAILEHGGDFSAAASELGAKEYGDTPKPKKGQEDAPLIRVIDALDFMQMEFPPRENVLSPWLPRQGITMIYAYRGIGKTMVSLSIGYTVASGGKMWGWEAPSPRGVLFIDGEMPGKTLQDRLANIALGCEKEPAAPFRIITPDLQPAGMFNLSIKEHQHALTPYLDGIDLIILDNLSTLCRTGKENEGEAWLPVQEWALQQRAAGRSVLFIHHAGKNGEQRGTSRREDTFDTTISLKRPGDYTPDKGACFEVHFEKARGIYGDETKPFEAQLVTNASGGLGWVTKLLEQSTLEKVADLLNEGIPQHEIADLIGVSKGTVSKKKNEAQRLGLLK